MSEASGVIDGTKDTSATDWNWGPGQLSRLARDVESWANARGLIKPGNRDTQIAQLFKFIEEATETTQAFNKKKGIEAIKDGIGDTMVVAIILARDFNLTIEECLQHAYDQIKNRTGKTVDGNFIKDEKSQWDDEHECATAARCSHPPPYDQVTPT